MLAELLTDFPERFQGGGRVFLAPPGFEGEKSEARTVEVTSFWLPVGRNEGRVVLHFAGVETISDAEGLAGLDVVIPETERRTLEDDSVYIIELVGCTVYDGSQRVGIVEDVQFAMTPDGNRRLEDAAPLLAVISDAGDEILIPFAKTFLVSMDTETKRIEMTLPEGLVEINRGANGKDQK